MEWAHAIAPKANILLVEANSASFSDLLTAVDYARHATGVVAVSMSWGGGEFSGESAYDSYFTTPSGHGGVTFVASSGDSGAPVGYPAISPNVLSVGGTTLNLNSQGGYSERVGLERQRRRHQRLRIPAELPERRGHAEHDLPHQSRRGL